LTLLFFDMIT